MSDISLSLPGRTRRFLALLITAALVALTDLGAQRPAPPPVAADSLRIYLMTMGPGDQVFELFGHNALWVHDPAVPVDRVYNWGVFDFRTPGFIGRFLVGDMRYIMASDAFDTTMMAYRYLNRNVSANELKLTESEKRELLAFIKWNELPENRTYRYDYYLDNCSTRVRDAIDRVVGGAVRAHLKSIPTDETYRSHSLRLMQSQKAMVTGVELALGRPTDAPLTADQTSFLPGQLQRHIQGVRLDGGRRPLLGETVLLHEATRAPEPTTVPKLWKGLLPIGLALAALVLVLCGPDVGRRRALATVVAIVAGLLGLLGTVLMLLATITDHVAAHYNENMFMVNPLWLAIAIVAPMVILRGRARKPALFLAVAAASIAVLAVVIHTVGLSRQPNWDIIGLVLPVQLAIAWVVRRASLSS